MCVHACVRHFVCMSVCNLSVFVGVYLQHTLNNSCLYCSTLPRWVFLMFTTSLSGMPRNPPSFSHSPSFTVSPSHTSISSSSCGGGGGEAAVCVYECVYILECMLSLNSMVSCSSFLTYSHFLFLWSWCWMCTGPVFKHCM